MPKLNERLLTHGPTGRIKRPLQPGEHLTRREFHTRYEQYHEDVKFELIGGVVYMVPPAGYEHGSSDFRVSGVVFMYEAETPGVTGLHNITIQLGGDSEPQPDCILCIKPEYGGQTWVNGKYLAGPPELIIEVADTSTAYDLTEKRKDYHAYGVLEYVVVSIRGRDFHWFDLARNEELTIDNDGVLRSIVFPGLWLDRDAVFQKDMAALQRTLQTGLKSKEHAAFVKYLQRKRESIARLKKKDMESKPTPKRRSKGDKS